MQKKNILVLGSDGMLGYDVMQALYMMSNYNYSFIDKVIGLDVSDGYDFTNSETLVEFLNSSSIKFDYVINCIAYTNTNNAENSTDGKDLSYELNALVPKNLAYACNLFSIKLIHISTDWVFSQKTGNYMFSPYDDPYPVNTYGKDKLLGEQFIENEFKDNSKCFAVCRVSWLYGTHNNKSFIHKFLNNVINSIKEEKYEIEMTSNEYSVPTSTLYVVDTILDVIRYDMFGIIHAVPRIDEIVSRYDYANEILTYFKDDKRFANIKLIPVERESYWPQHSTMISTSKNIHWKNDLRRFMQINNNVKDFIG